MWRSPQRNMHLVIYYAKCDWDARECLHEFHVAAENKMSWNGNIGRYFLLICEISGGENYLRKLFSLIEISRIPTKYLPCFYSLFFIICFIINFSMISAHWVVLVHSPQCSSTIYVENVLLPGYEKGNFLTDESFRFPYANHISYHRG